MVSIDEVLERLQYRSTFQSELNDILENEQFHLPILDTDAEQEVRQRPNYEELVLEMYVSPEEPDLKVDYDLLSYVVEDIEIRETGTGPVYLLNRAAGRTNYEGVVKLTLDFGETELPPLPLNKYLENLDLDVRPQYAQYSTEMTLWIEENDVYDVVTQVGGFNHALAMAWGTPDTIEEVVEAVAKWKSFNDLKERFA